MNNFYETLFNNLGDVNYEYFKKECNEENPRIRRERRNMERKKRSKNMVKPFCECGCEKKETGEERLLKAIFGEKNNGNLEISEASMFFTPEKIIRDRSHKTGRVTTIVFWKDHTKTVVKQMESDSDDAYLAFCAALTKKIFNSTDKAQKVFKKSLKVDKTILDNKKEESKNIEKNRKKEDSDYFGNNVVFNTFLDKVEVKDLKEEEVV